MTWKPYFTKEREPCAACGTKSYITPWHGDCEYTQGKVFCNLYCKTTFRIRRKFLPRLAELHEKRIAHLKPTDAPGT